MKFFLKFEEPGDFLKYFSNIIVEYICLVLNIQLTLISISGRFLTKSSITMENPDLNAKKNC